MKDKVTRLMQGLWLRYTLIGVALLVAAMLAALYVPLASAVTSTGGVINGCVQNATNASAKVLNLTVVREDGTDVCPSGYTKLPWNQAGIQGPKGDKGDQGDQGDQGEKGDKGDPGESGPAFAAKQTPLFTGPNIVSSADTEVLTKTVPAGNYAINAKVSLENIDDDDVANAHCYLTAGGTMVDHTVQTITLGINLDAQDLDQVANSQEIPLQAAVSNLAADSKIAIVCNSFSESARVDAMNAAITAIKVGSVQ